MAAFAIAVAALLEQKKEIKRQKKRGEWMKKWLL